MVLLLHCVYSTEESIIIENQIDEKRFFHLLAEHQQLWNEMLIAHKYTQRTYYKNLDIATLQVNLFQRFGHAT